MFLTTWYRCGGSIAVLPNLTWHAHTHIGLVLGGGIVSYSEPDGIREKTTKHSIGREFSVLTNKSKIQIRFARVDDKLYKRFTNFLVDCEKKCINFLVECTKRCTNYLIECRKICTNFLFHTRFILSPENILMLFPSVRYSVTINVFIGSNYSKSCSATTTVEINGVSKIASSRNVKIRETMFFHDYGDFHRLKQTKWKSKAKLYLSKWMHR